MSSLRYTPSVESRAGARTSSRVPWKGVDDYSRTVIIPVPFMTCAPLWTRQSEDWRLMLDLSDRIGYVQL